MVGNIWIILDAQGRKKVWFAEQLGCSAGHVSKLRNGERVWTPGLRERASLALQLPQAVLSFAPAPAPAGNGKEKVRNG